MTKKKQKKNNWKFAPDIPEECDDDAEEWKNCVIGAGEKFFGGSEPANSLRELKQQVSMVQLKGVVCIGSIDCSIFILTHANMMNR